MTADDKRRADWLARRRLYLTASDVAAVLGESERRGPFAVWAEKVHGYEPQELRIMRRGRLMEPVIAAEYAEESGRPVYDSDPYELQVHPSIPWLAATLDRRTEGCHANPAPPGAHGIAPAELKNVAGVKAAQWRLEPPTEYQIQAQVQLACTGAEWVSLVAMIAGAATVWKDMLPHSAFLAAAYPRLEAFWLLVQRKTPPPADGLPGTTAAIKALYDTDDGETIALDTPALQLANDLDQAALQLDKAEAHAQALENQLRARMASASFGALPDGSYLSLRRTERRGYTRTVAPGSYRTLRRFWPRAKLRR